MVVASHPIRSSKSRVNREPRPGERHAFGEDPVVDTAQPAQIGAAPRNRQRARSRCRHVDETGRVSCRAVVVKPHFGQRSFRVRILTATTTLVGWNSHVGDGDAGRSQQTLEYSGDAHGLGLLGSVGLAAPNLRTTRACHADPRPSAVAGRPPAQSRNRYRPAAAPPTRKTSTYKDKPRSHRHRSPTLMPEDPVFSRRRQPFVSLARPRCPSGCPLSLDPPIGVR